MSFEDYFSGARLLDGYSVGSFKTGVDAQAAIAALHILMHWTHNTYRPWFGETILQPLPAKAL